MKKIIYILLFVSSYNCFAQQLDSLSLDTLTGYESIELAMQQPDKVVKLVLRKKKLKSFPPEIFTFKNLQYLDLSKNQITDIPAEIGDLEQLQVLMLSKNQIEQLPATIGKLKNLKWLDVNQNELFALPEQIGYLENLEYLDLWSNNITVFPDDLMQLKKLKVLDLRVIIIDDEVQEQIQSYLPKTKIHFSPGCRCKTQ